MMLMQCCAAPAVKDSVLGFHKPVFICDAAILYPKADYDADSS